MPKKLYFDIAASSPECEASKQARLSYEQNEWSGANPHSLHSYGRAAFSALESARSQIARAIGASRPGEVYITSGGTEANAIALYGLTKAALEASHGKRRRIIVSAIEHASVLDCAKYLEQSLGIQVDICPFKRTGIIDLDALDSLLASDVALVSCMYVNNEIGTIQPIGTIASKAHAYGALMHTDAVQALGRIDVNLSALHVDAASFAAHKIGGPVSTGVLYVKARTPIVPLSIGGGQESGLRSGTVDVCGVLSFNAALHDFIDHKTERLAFVHGLTDYFYAHPALINHASITFTIDPKVTPTVPGFVHLLIDGIHSEALVLALDERGFEVSGGSACSSSSLEPSHVVTALGIPKDLAYGSLRITFDHRTTKDDCEALINALITCTDTIPQRNV
ncbi:MAG: cysteine desulfurase [Coriobacteriales bacterium]|nr:cysteine desulfurase [Coriobacteriales bacterium]